MRALIVSLLMLAGCGQQYECPSTLFARWVSDEPLDCEAISSNEQLAVEVLTDPNQCLLWNGPDCLQRGRRMDPSMMWVFKLETVHVESSKLLDEGRDGEYDLMRGFVLGSEGLALVHEMEHHLDVLTLDVTTISHDGWVEHGYYSTAHEYIQRAAPVTPESP